LADLRRIHHLIAKKSNENKKQLGVWKETSSVDNYNVILYLEIV